MKEIILNFERELRFTSHGEPRTGFLRIEKPRRGGTTTCCADSITCVAPALEFRQQPPVLGVTTLLWGWWGVLTGDFPWFATGAYFVSALFAGLKQRVVAIVCSAIALGLGSLSHWVGKWYFNEAEGTPVERLGAAYYFRMASFAVLPVGMARVRIARRGETGGRS